MSDIIVQCTTANVVPNRKQILQPWVTPGLLRCMRFRDTLHRRHKKTPKDKALETTYKRYRNYCNSILQSVKNKYDSAELQDAKNNIKKTWKVIKRVGGLNQKKMNLLPSY